MSVHTYRYNPLGANPCVITRVWFERGLYQFVLIFLLVTDFYFLHSEKCKSSMKTVTKSVLSLFPDSGPIKCSFKHFIWGEGTYLFSQWLLAA